MEGIVEVPTKVNGWEVDSPNPELNSVGGVPTRAFFETNNWDGEDKNWQDEANCLGVDPDLFFPERGASTREAKEVCRACVVRLDCLEYSLESGERFGIWGGLSERERRRIKRQRSQARKLPTSA